VTPMPSAFALPDRLRAKRDAGLIGGDEAHFAAIETSLADSVSDLADRLDAALRAAGGDGQAALDRDLEVHRLTARLRTLRRYGLDLCLGRMVPAGATEPVYLGRAGLTDWSGRRLLLDWRTPAAEPFFGATHANPMGLESRRRYRWTLGRVSDYWDEVFTLDGLERSAALDDESAFIATLGSSRSSRMRDVLGTIQADQDAIIRAGSRGAFVVDGGPGTGKTVVALHRTAYLLYSDVRLSREHGRVLFVGPGPSYLAYIDDVLPSLGEDSVQICTLRDLVAEGRTAAPESDSKVIELKSDARLLDAVEAAVRSYERPPAATITVETPWADIRVSRSDWAEAFDAAEPGSSHNESHDEIRDALVEILIDKLTGDAADNGDDDEFDAYGLVREDARGRLRRLLASDRELMLAFEKVWPLLDARDVVARLWSDAGFLQRCAPWLAPHDIAALQRNLSKDWTIADLPFLDAARQRIGDPEVSRIRRSRDAAVAAERDRMSDVVDQLIASDDSDMHIMSMLRGQDLRATLVDEAALPAIESDALAGPFAHIVVDEAQELTDAEWRMLLVRCPSRSFTIAGDRAQARHGFPETWHQRLQRVGLDDVSVGTLTINYRTPEEVMAVAEPVIRAAIPDANVPISIRRSGVPVRTATRADRDAILDNWLEEHDEGVACVIGDPAFEPRPRVRSLSPEEAKGLEFDLVILVESSGLGVGIEGAVDRYVAMTRATDQLVLLAPAGRS
jgi:DNA helicase IV